MGLNNIEELNKAINDLTKYFQDKKYSFNEAMLLTASLQAVAFNEIVNDDLKLDYLIKNFHLKDKN